MPIIRTIPTSPLDKQYRMMKLITDFYALAKKALSQGVNVDKIIDCGWIEKAYQSQV